MGERSVNKIDDGVYVFTHISPKVEPLAPATARAKFSSQCGAIVRDKIAITYKDWDKVPAGDKKTLWDEIKKRFQFPNGYEAMARNCALQTMDKSWRGWKNTLNTQYMKKSKTPFKTYGKITPLEWDEFVKFKTSPEEMAKSKLMSDLAKRNKWHHRLDSGGYTPKIEQWNKEEEEMKKAGVPVPMEDWNI